MEIEHIFCGGLYAKKCTFTRGERAEQHKHTFDHLSVVASGFVRVFSNGNVGRDYGPGDTIEIPAETEHAVHALTDAVWLCLHRTDVTDPAQVDETLISTHLQGNHA